MRDQAEDTVNWELCANQIAINNAYSSRGLHFYPVVKSLKAPQDEHETNIFALGDNVYVSITKYRTHQELILCVMLFFLFGYSCARF